MIRVLIVDDSATARHILREILESDKRIEVVGLAADAFIARDMILELKPNVICLDVEMPRMDGVTFLQKLMTHFPTPVVMVSSLTRKSAQVTLDALEAGAVDYVAKPHSNIYDGKDEIRDELIQKVIDASYARVQKVVPRTSILTNRLSIAETTNKVIAIGSSTGGTEALKVVLQGMPKNSPAIIIVQHMPDSFIGPFASRLDSLCEIDVKVAKNGDFLAMGTAYIAQGGLHMVLRRSGARYFVEIGSGQKVSGHCPSVDVLFNSVAKVAGGNALGVILTGMGSDGAKGMFNMHQAGAKTIAQSEETCVVFGMPKEAIKLGAVDSVVPLGEISSVVVSKLSH
ncbi:chemotaxis response regulator protein-glutamate methylesterase [Sulfurospirillum diekertiae]|uniref:Protein-glutamate methylesterase/protein-glutamine glutaminase n=1 Tax=Sulfurospirillum diekertiae TaxID=1854492 RepID=A0A6G9VRX8_9BACT|nr:chemotaxis response regulator protein-glutamate methylesterase [Sulfurospirillum diekertiae]QIR75618.1 chemotaxis response regulator protein-glutamate methylesterase [Sulfurospirillum diekertiae]QIR78267.1 chemotaxis response regulator protein-glutamate methylesterase [Sulfurospirillum diekertiae]